ncbi:hypothetical protein ACFYZN_15685 [Streptomyces sp. NPDC001777]|uniref:hypothetical protein n=1 Tax=Streptomyces sp. NPDC001777 TaxID=3364608 RepID=UPI0036AAAAD9
MTEPVNGAGRGAETRTVGAVRVRRALGVVGLVMALGAAATGCGEAEETPEYVGTEEACHGVFKGRLAKTVESAMGASSFHWTDPKRLDQVVDALKTGYESGHRWARGDTLCRLTPEGGGRKDRAGITFYMYAPQDVGDFRLPEGGRLYAMGKQAEATPESAALYFECVSPQFKGSKARPMRIQGSLGRPEDRGQRASDPREVSLTMLHAASLFLAKKLQCENNGGLPEKPVLTPKQPLRQ